MRSRTTRTKNRVPGTLPSTRGNQQGLGVRPRRGRARRKGIGGTGGSPARRTNNRPFPTRQPRIPRQQAAAGMVLPDVTDILGVPVNMLGDPREGGSVSQQIEERQLFKRHEINELLRIRASTADKLPELEVVTTSLSLYGPEEMDRIAVARIDVADTPSKAGKAGGRRGTVDDPRLGPGPERGEVCQTCQLTNAQTGCPGHYGIIQLNTKIIHPLFRKQLVQVLNSVCHSCGGLLLTKQQLEEAGIYKLRDAKKLEAISEASKGLPCRQTIEPEDVNVKRCIRNMQFNVSKVVESGQLWFKTKDKKDRKDEDFMPEDIMSLDEAYKILNALSAEDVKTLGFTGGSHPKFIILSSLLVIPPCTRPPTYLNGTLQPDSLTREYNNIVRQNNKIITATDEKTRKDAIKRMTSHISHLIDNSDGQSRQGRNQPNPGIKKRLQGKEALVRQNMMGKRTNYSGRTVVDPDPTLKFGQIRIPIAMAKILTIPEEVGPHNIKKITELLSVGKINYITPISGKASGRRVRVNKDVQKLKLRYGDIAHRWLQDGDFVLANRQPTLHKGSIMGYEVVLGSQLSVGMHLAATTPHNMDFDGDEANIHVPQTPEALREVATLMNVRNCLMSGEGNSNIIGAVMDVVTGAYLLTYRSDITVDVDDYYDIRRQVGNPDVEGRNLGVSNREIQPLAERLSYYGLTLMSGRGLFSMLLPGDMSYIRGEVIIKNGVLIQGAITKKHVGTSGGSIIQAIVKDYGMHRAAEFITDLYFALNRWLRSRSFSIGVTDCMLPQADPKWDREARDAVGEIMPFMPERRTRLHPEVEREVQMAFMTVEAMGEKPSDPLEEERQEKMIQGSLNRAKGMGTRVQDKYLPDDNAMVVMSRGGGKGSGLNTAQTTSMLGQQYNNGQRMPTTLSGGSRTLPMFDEDDLDPRARGFVINSFMTGLTPAESMFQYIAARNGLVDTSVKTGVSGDIQRRMTKALEDIVVQADGSTRNSSGQIFQFTYGDDSMDPSLLERVTTKVGTFPSFINLKRAADRINAAYGQTTNIPLGIMAMETEMIYKGRPVFIIDVFVNKIKVMYKDDRTKEILPKTILTSDFIKVFDYNGRAVYILAENADQIEVLYADTNERDIIGANLINKTTGKTTVQSTEYAIERPSYRVPLTSLLVPNKTTINVNGRPALVLELEPDKIKVLFKDDSEIQWVDLKHVALLE